MNLTMNPVSSFAKVNSRRFACAVHPDHCTHEHLTRGDDSPVNGGAG